MTIEYRWQEFVEDMGKFPNWLTLCRIVGFFFLLLPLLLLGDFVAAFLVFLFLALSDLFDGESARQTNMVTWLGKGLDPVADKILLIGTMFILGLFKTYPIPGLLLVALEVFLLVIGVVAFLSKDERFNLGANSYGKIKAVSEVVVIFFLFIEKLNIFPVSNNLILFLFWSAIVYAALSILGHLRVFDYLRKIYIS